jgi:hypothetical protein
VLLREETWAVPGVIIERRHEELKRYSSHDGLTVCCAPMPEISFSFKESFDPKLLATTATGLPRNEVGRVGFRQVGLDLWELDVEVVGATSWEPFWLFTADELVEVLRRG